MKSSTPKPMSRSLTIAVFGMFLLLCAFLLAFHAIGAIDLTTDVLSTATGVLVSAVVGIALRLRTSQPIGRQSDEGTTDE